jgi:hypothetical protein
MRTFVTEQNVTRYRRWLEDGVEEATRNTLLKLWLFACSSNARAANADRKAY